jgi:hypothetical protein
MKRWLIPFLTILASILTPVTARAELPSFVRSGLVVTYAVSEFDRPPNAPQPTITPSLKVFTVRDVQSNPIPLVEGLYSVRQPTWPASSLEMCDKPTMLD